ncbi:Hypothetical protein NTJ_12445 [Nesidiocoris tenuis]|uniref:Stathmin n=1 Tax=Nesidiocoris tenuis TaxID=355587 RepID=A0ABN7B5F9_9HEMI|nr:Hypothetical protein NTJ_12445 [Nesidiocoris tenuis]
MGCAAGKPNVVGGPDQQTKEFEKAPPTAKIEKATVPPIAIDDSITISARTSQGLAFEVPIEDGETNIIKKHPPKRFQKLEDQQISSLTHRLLDEKQAEAEQRRQQILSQRVQSAKVRQKTKRSLIHNGESNGLLIESMHHEPTTVAL